MIFIVWFLDLLGLLYHNTVDRKVISAGAILLAAHAVEQLLCTKCKFSVNNYEDLPTLLLIQELVG